MPEPLVSIGIPVFNGARYLEAAIRANLNQSYRNLEIIISDNASTDRTEAICRELAVVDKRIKFHRNDRNIGAAANYNKIFHLASGEFFRWSNADDLTDPELVAQTLPVLQSTPEAVIAYGRTCLIDENGASLGDYDDNMDIHDDLPADRYMSFHNRVTLTNIIYGLMRASAMRNTPLMGSGKFPHADIHFTATMALQGKFIQVPRVLFFRRMHATAMSSDPAGQQAKTFWTASDARFVLPKWRFELAGMQTILESSLPPREKARLLAFSTKRLFWFRKELARDLIRFFS